MALGIVLVIGGILLIAALMDWRTRRSGHRVPSGYDLNRQIPMGTQDNSGFRGRPTQVMRPGPPPVVPHASGSRDRAQWSGVGDDPNYG